MRGHIALIQVEFVFPEQLAGVGVEAHEALLLGFARAGGVFEVQMIAEHDGSGAAAIGRFPGQALAIERPFFGQAFLAGDAVAIGSAPVRPVAHRAGLLGEDDG